MRPVSFGLRKPVRGTTRALPLKGGGLGGGSIEEDPHPTASQSTSPFQGEVNGACSEVGQCRA
jgi:hypothetical protein